jgi:hypothetical protein
VTDQWPAVPIGRAPEYLASGISHQNERMILLVAAEHNGAPNFRWMIGKMRSAAPSLVSSQISAQSLPAVADGRMG